jgi:hypothetical protein
VQIRDSGKRSERLEKNPDAGSVAPRVEHLELSPQEMGSNTEANPNKAKLEKGRDFVSLKP